MRGGKELPSSYALDSPSVLSKLATPKPTTAMNFDMSHVIDDATLLCMILMMKLLLCVILLCHQVNFLDEQLPRVRENEIIEDAIIDDSDDERSPNDYVLPVVPKC